MKKYKLLQDYKAPDMTIYAGVIHDETNWLDRFVTLSKFDLDNKKDWFEEVKEGPLFVTEDKVKIFKGNSYVILYDYSDWNIVTGFIANGNHDALEGLNFSTEKAAQAYIEENKPIYSKKQIKEALDNSYQRETYHFFNFNGNEIQIDRFKEEDFKNKLNL